MPVTAHGLGDRDPHLPLVQTWVDTADPAAFARLVDEHEPYVRHLARRVLGPGQEAEFDDVAQEVFARLAANLHAFRGDCLFRTWLHRLTLNCALDRRRGMRWRAIHLDVSVLDRHAAGRHEDDPCRRLEDEERQRVVHECLQELPETVRDLIRLHYWENLSVEQIAARLCRPAATVRSSLYRGRRVLFRAMTGRGLHHGARGPARLPRTKGEAPTRQRLVEQVLLPQAAG